MPALFLALVLLAPSAAGSLGLAPGDLVVGGAPAGETIEGLYRVDAATRGYELVAAGRFRDHAIAPSGTVFAIEDDRVVRIDPAMGTTEPVEGGAGLGALEGIAVDRAGVVYLTASEMGVPPVGSATRVLRLDPNNGDVSTLASGGFLSGAGFPYSLDLELAADGAPLVLGTGDSNSLSAVIRIDPEDGSQMLLTDASELLATAVGLGVAPDGSLLVTADGRALCDCVALIDPQTGGITGGSLRILVEGEPQGTAIATDIAVDSDGTIWLLAYAGGPVGSGLFRWDLHPQLESDGSPFLAMSTDPLGDVQAVLGVCGDGEWSGPEECEDGNRDSGDGCSDTCLAEVCGNQRRDAGEDCDDGNPVSGDGCDVNCSFTACGNDLTTEGEECDDGNLRSGDGCDENCTLTGCGNGVVTDPEACDDGDTIDDNGCNRSCRVDVGFQTRKQRQCIKVVNQGIDRLARARAKTNERCLAEATSGDLGDDPAAFDLCLGTDPRGRVARAQRELPARERESCDSAHLPELALGEDRLAGAPAASALPTALVRDIFGDPAEAARSDRGAARCQARVLSGTHALFDAIWRELRDAKTDKLAGRGSDAAVNDTDLTSHVAQVVAGSRSIGSAAGVLRERTNERCGGLLSLPTLFPGCDAADANALAGCAEQAARCRSCLLLVEADPGVALECDDFDDGSANASCWPLR